MVYRYAFYSFNSWLCICAGRETEKASAKIEKISGDVGWVTLDKKTMVLVKGGEYLAEIEMPRE